MRLLWKIDREIHQNPLLVKRQSGIITPYNCFDSAYTLASRLNLMSNWPLPIRKQKIFLSESDLFE